jgi:polyhydroxyalkanoate synthase
MASNLRHIQFGALVALRRMQGDVLALLGFGPAESSYSIAASGSYWRLRDYEAANRSRPVLIVAAPIKRPYIWDLTPAVSAIRYCLEAGLNVYLLEWLPASSETCRVGLDECAHAVSACLAAIAPGAAGPKPVLMGHSLGGTLAAIATAIAPGTISGLVLLSSAICFRPNESAFRDALVSLVPEPASESDPYPGSILSEASAMASPEAFIWSRLMDATLSAAGGRSVGLHARVERWALDEVPLPGRLVKEIVESLYRENLFCRGMLKVADKTIGLPELSVPILAVVNTADAVAPPASLAPMRDVLGPDRLRIVEYPGEAGVCLQHLGILLGREAYARIWPGIIGWIKARWPAVDEAQALAAPDSMPGSLHEAQARTH